MDFISRYHEDEQRFFQFNHVYVVETLFEPDTRTGKNLFQDVLKPSRYHHPWLSASYHPVANKKQLFALLADIKREALGGQVFPWLHIEGHGNTKGLEVGKGGERTIVKWEDLGHEFRKINVATKNNLMLVVASCYGSEVYKGIRVADRAPFFGFIAPIKEVTEQEVEEGFNAFYTRILNSHEFDEAMLELRGARNGGKPRFTFLVSEVAFRHVSDNLLTENRDATVRTRQLLDHPRMKAIQAEHNLTFLELVARTKGVLDNREQLIDGWFDSFVMKDLGSENELPPR